MRKLGYLLCLMALSTASLTEAKVIAETNNLGGGRIVLTDEACRQKGYRLAYTQMSGQQTILGCWSSDDSFVHIMWYDNDLRSYPIENWILKNYKPNT